jgi:UDP-N-acetylmuramyl pentapeptide phosphotransferase/UDP-N-acetylglucosamine-1-phosphate transferase
MTTAVASFVVLAAFLAALAETRIVRDFARRRRLLDQPNGRSSHAVPVPRLGGLAIVTAFLAGSIAFAASSGGVRTLAPILAATAVISALGLLDDLRPMPARVRFAVQAATAALVVALSGPPRGSPWLELVPWPLLAPLLVLWIVWLTNLYNFMDGIDGLAGGQALMAGVAVAAAAFAGGASTTGWLLLVLAAASAGFLVFNFPPGSIFMGDVGSTAIGFFLACVPLLPEARPVPIELVGIALSMFILDATVTLARRIARGERWFEAHRTHYYQRPVAMGLSHRAVTLVAYGGMCIVGTSAAAYQGAGPEAQVMLLLVPVVVFAVLAATVHGLERRAAQGAGGVGNLGAQ